MPVAAIGKNKYYYEIKGSGEQVLIFSHAFLLNLNMYQALVASLESSYTCVVYDHPGHGNSELHEVDLSFEKLVEELAQFIQTVSPKAPVVFVGSSLGGMQGLALDIKYPTLISQLVLLGTPLHRENFFQRLPFLALKILIPIFGLSTFVPLFMKQFFGKSFVDQEHHQELLFFWKKELQNNSVVTIQKFLTIILAREHYAQQFASIQCPILILVGDEDASISIKSIRQLASSFQQKQLQIMHSVGHLPVLEAPKIVSNYIQDFIQQTPFILHSKTMT
jgi:pimeloyl-ACP methyl ester carboxylesterase